MNAQPQFTDYARDYLRLARQQLQRGMQFLRLWLQPEHLQQLRPLLQYQAGILAGFALLAALLLGLADLATRGVIETRLQEDLQANLAEVIPSALHDNNLLQDAIRIDSADAGLGGEQTLVYLAKQNGRISAVGFQFVAPDGYAGPIRLIMGIDRNGEILGVRVIAHTETPGLGDKIEISKSKWILEFDGKSLNNLSLEQWAVKKDGGSFDQFAGATITPRKVVQAIRRGLDFFRSRQTELLATE
jgi:Na+-translocating ferredoxin:NAD+ oxidoreductase subunit G